MTALVANLFSDPRATAWGLGLADALLAIAAVTLAVSRRRGVAGTLAWIFAIVAFPFAGSVAYFLLANPTIRRTTRRKRLSAGKARQAIDKVLRNGGMEGVPHGTVLELVSRLTGTPPTLGNHVEILTDNHGAFLRKIQAVRNARESVWAEYYIVKNDGTGNMFLEILVEKAQEGLDVRLLFDAVGSSSIDKSRLEKLRRAGGKAEAFLPVNPLRRRWSVHLRNHRKILVTDGRQAFSGGMNLGNEYSGYFRRKKSLSPWRDTHLCVEGPAVRDFACIFAEDWAFATGETVVPPVRCEKETAPHPGALVSVILSGPDQKKSVSALAYFSGIASARDRCYLTSPYFVPDEPALRAMESAALRGVDVRILVPRESDNGVVRLAAWSFFPPLLEAGVRILEYEPSMLHAKTMVVDGLFGIVGSANMDIRSFFYNFEAGALVASADFASQLEAQFLEDARRSQEVTLATWYGKSRAFKLKVSLARLFSPLL